MADRPSHERRPRRASISGASTHRPRRGRSDGESAPRDPVQGPAHAGRSRPPGRGHPGSSCRRPPAPPGHAAAAAPRLPANPRARGPTDVPTAVTLQERRPIGPEAPPTVATVWWQPSVERPDLCMARRSSRRVPRSGTAHRFTRRARGNAGAAAAGWPDAVAARSATRRSSTRSRRRPRPSSASSASARSRRGLRSRAPGAARGMRSTRPLVARRGLAMRLGDRAIGHLDPRPVPPPVVARRGRRGRDAPVTDREALLARVDALERERRRAFDEAQREADALFAQYQLSQLIASGGASPSSPRPCCPSSSGWPTPRPARLLARRRPMATELDCVAARGRRDHGRTRPGAVRRAAGDRARASGRVDGPGARRATGSGSPSSRATSSRSRSRARGCGRRSSGSATSWSAIVDGATDLILQVDEDGRVVRLNPAGERLLGISDGRGASDGRVPTCSAARSPAATRREPARSPRYRAGGVPIAYRETAIRGADGQPIRVAGSYAAAPRRARTAATRATAILRDISAVRALEELREGFVATVSHELRTPLALIRGYAETLLHLDLEPAEQRALPRADRRGDGAAGGARRPDPRRHPSPGRPAHPRARADDRSRPSSPGCAATSTIVRRRRSARRRAARRPAARRRRRRAGRPGPREPRRQRAQVRRRTARRS